MHATRSHLHANAITKESDTKPTVSVNKIRTHKCSNIYFRQMFISDGQKVYFRCLFIPDRPNVCSRYIYFRQTKCLFQITKCLFYIRHKLLFEIRLFVIDNMFISDIQNVCKISLRTTFQSNKRTANKMLTTDAILHP